MPKLTPDRWAPDSVADNLADLLPGLLDALDAEARRRGVDPATATIGELLTVGAEAAYLMLVNRGEPPRVAEAILTRPGVSPTAIVRRLDRSRTIMVRPFRTDP
jgi:hypothetical protein